MKKGRFLVVILAIMLLITTLVGCQKDNVTVLVNNTDKTITVYTDKGCSLDLTIKIKDGEKNDTVTKIFEFNGDETVSLEIENFVSHYYSKDAIITEVSNGQPQYSSSEIFGITCGIVVIGFMAMFAISIIGYALALRHSQKKKS